MANLEIVGVVANTKYGEPREKQKELVYIAMYNSMTDVTPVLDHFRIAARSLWNAAFWPDPAFRNWDAVERFQDIQRILFDELVLTKLDREWPLDDLLRKPIPFLQVVPATSSVPVMIAKPRPNTRNSYWDDPIRTLTQGDAELHFQSYFDWNELDYQDLLYYRATIAGFAMQPHLVGREVLIERQYGSVWLCLARRQLTGTFRHALSRAPVTTTSSKPPDSAMASGRGLSMKACTETPGHS